jgi:hypothetical protein
MLLIADFLIGFFVVLGCLFLVGITRGRRVSQKTWVALWSTVSLALASFVVVSFVLGEAILLACAMGGSLGYIVAVTIHTVQHF